jgi:hypothetical protein
MMILSHAFVRSLLFGRKHHVVVISAFLFFRLIHCLGRSEAPGMVNSGFPYGFKI